MPEAPLPNSPEARTETGELKTPQTSSTTPNPEPNNAPAPAEQTGAPEKYTDYTAPEGYKPDPDAVGAANTVFKELGLTQAQAQKLMDLQFARDLSFQKGQETAIAEYRTQQEAALKADPDIGSKLPAVQAEIGKALQHLDPTTRQNFQAEMDATGIGNSLAFVKAFYSMAQKLNEGQHVAGDPAAPKPNGGRPTAAAAMYPHLSGQ